MSDLGQTFMFWHVSILKWGMKMEKVDFFPNTSCRFKNKASMVYPHPIGQYEMCPMLPEFKGLFGLILNSVTQPFESFI